MKALKPLRIAVSFILTFLLLLVFADYYRMIPQQLSSILTYFQFIPSLLSFIVTLSSEGTGFILIAGLTFLAGRIYCSFICPLGFSQDIFIHTGNKVRKKRVRGTLNLTIGYSTLF